jgi:hypothetical protein
MSASTTGITHTSLTQFFPQQSPFANTARFQANRPWFGDYHAFWLNSMPFRGLRYFYQDEACPNQFRAKELLRRQIFGLVLPDLKRLQLFDTSFLTTLTTTPGALTMFAVHDSLRSHYKKCCTLAVIILERSPHSKLFPTKRIQIQHDIILHN